MGVRFAADGLEPGYLGALRDGRLTDRVAAARSELAECRACPRDCGADRIAGDTGSCGIAATAVVASVFPHHGEEDCLRGWRGSGTIFFAGCNLLCVFCQNWDLSRKRRGVPMSTDEIASSMLWLQDQGCHNINLVTPEHVVPHVVEALAVAVPKGLRLPLVYNTSAYDGPTSLRLMDGLVDVYMPDFKFWTSSTSQRLAAAKDYPEVARSAIREMHRQVGDLRFDRNGLARRGLLVRHLVMPGLEDETSEILRWLAGLSPDTFVNIMDQYRPEHRVPGSQRYADIDRRPRRSEIAAAYRVAREAGLWRFDGREAA